MKLQLGTSEFKAYFKRRKRKKRRAQNPPSVGKNPKQNKKKKPQPKKKKATPRGQKVSTPLLGENNDPYQVTPKKVHSRGGKKAHSFCTTRKSLGREAQKETKGTESGNKG